LGPIHGVPVREWTSHTACPKPFFESTSQVNDNKRLKIYDLNAHKELILLKKSGPIFLE
jgi:hypothetical protein